MIGYGWLFLNITNIFNNQNILMSNELKSTGRMFIYGIQFHKKK